MKRYLVLAGLASLAAGGVSAQATNCATIGTGTAGQLVRDACQQAADVFQLMAPQLGVAIAGGNATLGQGGTLGGLGHFSVGVRANALFADLPEIADFPNPRTTGPQPGQELPSKNSAFGFPVVDAAIGIFKGFPLGVTNVGGVDLLVNGSYVPSIGDENDDLSISPDGNFRFGFGGRLGLLQESLVVPGVSVSYLRRDLPKTTMRGRSDNVELLVEDAKVETSAWRIVASKSLIAFGLAVGYGQDHYDESTNLSGSVSNVIPGTTQTFGPVSFAHDVTRHNAFADLSINILLLKIVGEVGRSWGGSFATPVNTFSSGAPDDARLYGSVGLRFGF